MVSTFALWTGQFFSRQHALGTVLKYNVDNYVCTFRMALNKMNFGCLAVQVPGAVRSIGGMNVKLHTLGSFNLGREHPNHR